MTGFISVIESVSNRKDDILRKILLTLTIILAACGGANTETASSTVEPEETTTTAEDSEPPNTIVDYGGPEVLELYLETTTTTEAPPPPPPPPVTTPVTTQPQTTEPVQAAPPPQESVTSQGSGNCGGDLPPCYVMNRESGGDPNVWNGGCTAPYGYTGTTSPCGGSTASGKWQFVRGTWGGYGGYTNAADAPEHVQDARARELWAGGSGCGHWSAC